ncbi:MAG: M28 family peptidase [Gemmatimonadetes bacterium]|nr:M28 family peptidase [Gemmatimonadota bacterium]
MKPFLTLSLAALATSATGQSEPGPVRGFPADRLPELARLERIVRSTPDTASIRRFLREITRTPHLAGTPGSRRVAEWALRQFRSYGLDAEIVEYRTLLPMPIVQRLELLAPVRYRARFEEPPIPEDRDSYARGVLPSYISYGADGDVTGEVVYANYGLPDDYDRLARLGIDVKGKIVFVRTGPHLRAIKGTEAQARGAAGVVMYHDPIEDGYWVGPMYPKGPMRPPFASERGGAADSRFFTGDPLTPGWAATPNARRLAREESPLLLQIPMMTLGYGEALRFLERLEGPVAPNDWKGAFPITYRLGPGPARARMVVKSDWSLKPIYNVVARIAGERHPDQWVIVGCHHDAWVFGADDPSAAAAAIVETARTFGQMVRSGWRPARTLVFALWDAEEQGHHGSVEWVEQHADELRAKTVAYLNADNYRQGIFTASGSHTLESFMREVARDTPDPGTGGSVLETLIARALGGAGTGADSARARDRAFLLTPVGSGTDYVGFLHHLGIPSLHIAYRNVGRGTYHSLYDSYRYFVRFLDPTLSYGKSMAGAFGAAVLRLSEAPLLPFSFADAARTYREYLADLERHPDAAAVDLGPIRSALGRLVAAGARFEGTFGAAVGLGGGALARRQVLVDSINTMIYQSERDLLHPDGLPRRPWYRHTIYSQGYYGGTPVVVFPAVREAIEQRDLGEAGAEIPKLAAALDRLAARVRSIADGLVRLREPPP